MNAKAAKSLDHLVLPVSSLETARNRLSAIGFTVAPDGFHPFGTGNCCVFFQNDTYLEPLAIIDPKNVAEAANKGNRFLSRDLDYRSRKGDDGFSMVALGTDDALEDLEFFSASSFDCGKVVSFQRAVVHDDGSTGEISIRLFVVSIEASPDFALFNCQWLSGRKFDDAHKIHANGAIGVCSVTLVGADAPDVQKYLGAVTGQVGDFGNKLNLQNASINLMSRAEYLAAYGREANDNSLNAVAFDIEVESIQAVKYVLFASGIASESIGDRLVVQAAEGQGYALGFVEKQGFNEKQEMMQ